jgi:hypothetical protein
MSVAEAESREELDAITTGDAVSVVFFTGARGETPRACPRPTPGVQ